jgi:hypothetical protein
MYSLIEMLRYKRPEGSLTQKLFCKRFLEPVFGQPDDHGNYTKIIGDKPKVSFMSHHDTVHKTDGMQRVWVSDDVVMSDSNCLGADCTTGVYIMLCMIEMGIPGVYVVHAAEEVGCKGSRALVKDRPDWFDHVKCAISFDRFGYESIVTHQMGMRTCSDTFADSLETILGLGMQADDTGVYTDSNEYAGVIPECTNISVGYFRQHTTYESQDLKFLESLVDSLVSANWDDLTFDRDPSDASYDFWWGSNESSTGSDDDDDLYKFVRENPQLVADYLESYGVTFDDLMSELYYNDRRSVG